MLVRDIMKTRLSSIQADATALAAACRMRDDGVGCLPVTESGSLVGIVTDRDLVLRCIAEGYQPARTAISSVMSVETVCCYEDQTDDTALDLMRQHGLMRLPVLNRKGVLVGLVSQRDLLMNLSTKRPHKVSFYKELISSDGHHHQVAVHVVYVTGAQDKEHAEAVAKAKLQKEMNVPRWSDVADGFTLDEPPHLGPSPDLVERSTN
jgi:CBS domain-containing protein